MSTKSMKLMCDTNEVWKFLYSKTTRPRILDTSIHIGNWPKYKDNINGNEIHFLRNNPIIDISRYTPIIQCPIKNAIAWLPSDHAFYCPCLPGHVRFSSWMTVIGRIGPVSRYVSLQNSDDIRIYIDIINKEWSEYNNSRGLSMVNLCQCIKHYDHETLGNINTKVNYKNYKKMTLKKMKTKRNLELIKSDKMLRKKHDIYQRECKKLEMVRKDLIKEEQISNVNKMCIDKIDNYLKFE